MNDVLIQKSKGTQERSSLQGWLRAAVLGANDGIVSTASLMVGVAAAESTPDVILTAGLAGLVAGAASMAAGEYVSVSAQSDFEEATRRAEQTLVSDSPRLALRELVGALEERGIEPVTARAVADQLAATQPVDAAVRIKYGITDQTRARPWQAAMASAAAFAAGALVPFGAAFAGGVWVTVVAALVALGITGALAADAGGAPRGRAALRVLMGGSLAMAISATVGHLVGGFF